MAPSIPQRALLAGPILRRADPTAIHVWLAVSSSMQITGGVFEPGHPETILGVGKAATTRIGSASSRLHVALVEITPVAGRFPTGKLLAYHLLVNGESIFTERHAGRNEPLGWGYGSLDHPTFVLRDADRISILHASCRKPHGRGADALRVADQILAENTTNPAWRPSALFLTGDQIYADDVADSLIGTISELAPVLCGADELVPWPGAPPPPEGRRLSTIGRGDRGAALKGLFTSGEAANHLVGFGEFAAMYLLAWGAAAWTTWPPRSTRFADLPDVRRYRDAIPWVRRLLANVPTYMIFDDHDVTDDWNLTPGWTFRASLHPLSRRVICNALAAFAVFQGWGNDPAPTPEGKTWPDLLHRVSDWVGSSTRADPAFEDSLFRRYWGFTTPPHPRVLVLDTRSHRETAGRRPNAPAILLDAERLAHFYVALKEMPSPLIVVSPVPLVGPAIIDTLQSTIAAVAGKEPFDLESWTASQLGYFRLRDLLHQRLRSTQQRTASSPTLREPMAVILSGDVHYSSCFGEVLTENGKSTPYSSLLLQFTASAAKNQWAETADAERIREVVTRFERRGPRRYAVYFQPSDKMKERLLRKLGESPLTALALMYVAPIISKQAVKDFLYDLVDEGAPLVLKTELGGEPARFTQEVALLKATSGSKRDDPVGALTFTNAVGWLRFDGTTLAMQLTQGGDEATPVAGDPRLELTSRIVEVN
jgi:hypothetical protein